MTDWKTQPWLIEKITRLKKETPLVNKKYLLKNFRGKAYGFMRPSLKYFKISVLLSDR
jgi:hypothetical protein